MSNQATGLRYDAGKMARYDLIPPEALEALAIHYGHGAVKYPDPPRNWELGMPWAKPFVSLMRHSWRWFRGESYDAPDPKMPDYRAHHMIAAAWNALAAYTYEVRGVGEDNRPFSDMLDLSVESAKRERCYAPAGLTCPVNYWYLATPYTRFPLGHDAASQMACELAARLLRFRVPVFSPIAHSHSIAVAGLRDVQVDHNFWMHADAPLMEAAGGLIVVTAESWEKSSGMAEEIKRFTAAGKPVVYWNPLELVPAILLPG